MPKDLSPSPDRGLPNEHYVDPAAHAAGSRALLRSTWAGLAVASDVPEPGDAVPISFDGVPLLLIRDREGGVRVFQNVCRHRGVVLVEEPRRIEGAIRCPYHSWCYATDGRLLATPHVGGPGRNAAPGIDRDALGLIELRSQVWRDVVWIDLQGGAPPFEEHMAPVMARWAEVERPLHHGDAFALRLRANWKLAVENYCEAYHLPWVHPGLNAYSRLEDHYDILGCGFSGQGTLVYRQLTGEGGARFPDFEGLPSRWDTGAEYLAVYPNVLLGAHRDHAYAIVLLPEGHDGVTEAVHIYYPTPEADPALRAANTAQWRTVFEEDVGVVEAMQRGRHAPGFDGGRFSPAMDAPTRHFHEWAAARLAG
jgi:phenylpropionate dioxygenase-like ring-hydroxylating dioxygenase large terminal subunit